MSRALASGTTAFAADASTCRLLTRSLAKAGARIEETASRTYRDPRSFVSRRAFLCSRCCAAPRLDLVSPAFQPDHVLRRSEAGVERGVARGQSVPVGEGLGHSQAEVATLAQVRGKGSAVAVGRTAGANICHALPEQEKEETFD